MEEFEVLDGVAEMFEGAEAEAAALELGEAAEVEENVAVADMAEAPAVAEGEGALARVRNFIETNPYGKRLWTFAKWAVKSGAGASAVFGIMYGLNKAVAKDAHEGGKRTALSQYLSGLQANWVKQGLAWTQDIKQAAAVDALAFPWIDATQ
jgi:hypothetical protein